jgi:oligopeptide/dipeptide ABC transporter ATP-binding protein
MTADLMLVVDGLTKHFPVRSPLLRRDVGEIHAVCDVSFEVERGQTFALVGESGSGKTTAIRCVVRLTEPSAGQIRLDTVDVLAARGAELKALRRRMQLVFQDPYASLNPRMTAGAIIADPLRVHRLHRQDERARVNDLLTLVGLDPAHAERFPNEFSGGQRQRIGIARALAVEPEVLILDEPVSALDVSIRAGIINLLEDLRDELGLTYVVVAHDLSVVRHMADRVAVMYLGRIVETGTRDAVYGRPAHPYTQALLSAIPVPDPRLERARERIVLTGELPSASDPPSGCRFRTRCWMRQDLEARGVDTTPCVDELPALVDRGTGHPAACHFAEC